MIVDSSAVVAVVLQEPGHEQLLEKLAVGGAGIGAPTLAECGLVLSARLGSDARAILDGLVTRLDLDVVAFSNAHWRAAVGAHLRYGRGRHRAGLNFGDCLTYAVASLADEPLLFVGDDFTHTDLRAA